MSNTIIIIKVDENNVVFEERPIKDYQFPFFAKHNYIKREVNEEVIGKRRIKAGQYEEIITEKGE